MGLMHEDGKKAFSGLMPDKSGKLPKMMESKRPDNAIPGKGKPMEGEHSELHDNKDGSFKTVKGGQEEEHPTLGHALMAMAGHHAPEGKHVHAHSHGGSVHSHGHSGGMTEGPNEHGSGEEAGQHMGNYLAENSESNDNPSEEQDHEGLSGFGG